MVISPYLKNALYQLLENVLDEHAKFDALQAQAKADVIDKEKHKESWLTHLFRAE
jgi:hypothetical protein